MCQKDETPFYWVSHLFCQLLLTLTFKKGHQGSILGGHSFLIKELTEYLYQ